ncbi:MAG: hypothetical protein V9E81_15080 [Marmoricola sp.]
MADPRRPKGSVEIRQMLFRLTAQTRELITIAARAHGMSRSAFMDAFIATITLSEDGLIEGVPVMAKNDEELPLSEAS